MYLLPERFRCDRPKLYGTKHGWPTYLCRVYGSDTSP